MNSDKNTPTADTADFELVEQLAAIMGKLVPDVPYNLAMRRLESAAGSLESMELYRAAPQIVTGRAEP